MSATDAAAARDPQRPVRLLHAEHDALLPILRRHPEEDFSRPTACPAWSVRDVLAHCAAALTMAATGKLHSFTPEENEVDVAERRDWPLPRLLAELSDGYLAAGPAIAESGGRLDGIAIGEWIHGGDVRDALDEPGAYASDGFDDAVALLADRALRKGLPLVGVSLPGEAFSLGAAQPGRARARLETDRATLMRLFAGRPADPAAYRLTGATAAEFEIF